jgi:hypothetical protein
MSTGTTIDLANIAPGDKVAWLDHNRFRTRATVGTVERLTPTQIVVKTSAGTYRFTRLDGRMIGATWSTHLRSPNDAAVVQALILDRAHRARHDIGDHLRNSKIRDPHEGIEVLSTVWRMADAAILDIKKRIEQQEGKS